MENVPLPPSVPPLQLIDEPVTVIGALPLSVPPVNVSVGIDCPDALLMERVPPETAIGVLIVPLMVFAADCRCVVAAAMEEGAASVGVSWVWMEVVVVA